MIAPHHGISSPMCRYSMQFCTRPTGVQPPRPSVANAGSAPAAIVVAASVRVSVRSTGIAGASGIYDRSGVIVEAVFAFVSMIV